MSKRILWIDNDPQYIKPFVLAMEDEGYAVSIAKTVSQGERLITNQRFDLVILDVMIPTMSEKEEETYPPDETEDSHKTGLLFYKRHVGVLTKNNTPILVMTVRIDKSITKDFLDAGLPPSNFVTKMELRETPVFLEKIRATLNTTGEHIA